MIFNKLIPVLSLATLLFFAPQNLSAQEDLAFNTFETKAPNEFEEVKVVALPKAIIATVTEVFNSATVVKAFVNNEEEYMLLLSPKDEGELVTLLIDKEGHWITPEY